MYTFAACSLIVHTPKIIIQIIHPSDALFRAAIFT